MKKTVRFILSLLSVAMFALWVSPAVSIAATGSLDHVHLFQAGIVLTSFIAGSLSLSGVAFTGPDISGITTNEFLVVANEVIRKKVNQWLLGPEARKYINVKSPMALPKVSASGNPRPYREQDDFTSGIAFTDRVLTVYQGKWDYQLNPEVVRNTYLAEVASGTVDSLATTFLQYAAEQVAKEYLSNLLLNTVYLGIRNGSGSVAADIADGWGTIIAALIVSSDLTPITTGAITTSNAVASVEAVADGVPSWMKEMGFNIICSYATLESYRTDYRTRYGFTFNPNSNGEYKLDGKNVQLSPRAFMGTSQRLIATIPGNLVYGTDSDSVGVFVTPHLDLFQVRMKMPIGFQIADTEAIFVNDHA